MELTHIFAKIQSGKGRFGTSDQIERISRKRKSRSCLIQDREESTVNTRSLCEENHVASTEVAKLFVICHLQLVVVSLNMF